MIRVVTKAIRISSGTIAGAAIVLFPFVPSDAQAPRAPQAIATAAAKPSSVVPSVAAAAACNTCRNSSDTSPWFTALSDLLAFALGAGGVAGGQLLRSSSPSLSAQREREQADRRIAQLVAARARALLDVVRPREADVGMAGAAGIPPPFSTQPFPRAYEEFKKLTDAMDLVLRLPEDAIRVLVHATTLLDNLAPSPEPRAPYNQAVMKDAAADLERLINILSPVLS